MAPDRRRFAEGGAPTPAVLAVKGTKSRCSG